MSFRTAIINIIGNLPDNVEVKKVNGDDESVSIYFRNNDQLYLYDAKLDCEFNLFNLYLDETQEYNTIGITP